MKLGLALGGVLLVVPGLVSCGGADDGDPIAEESERAVVSVDEFCAAAKKFENTFTETDTTNLAEGVDALRRAARDFKDLGTPADIPDDARDGLELTLDRLIGLPDDAAESDLLEVLDLSGDERAKSMAFEDYLDDSCPYRQGNDG